MPDDEPTEALEPSDGTFDLPAAGVASELPSILRRLSDTVLAVRADEFDIPVVFNKVVTQELPAVVDVYYEPMALSDGRIVTNRD